MKKLALLLVITLFSCSSDCENEMKEIEKEKEPEYIEVCDECTRYWYSNGAFINTRQWGWEGCEADGNIYRYEDRDGTSATYHYPSNPGSYYVIRCTTKQIEI